MRRLLIGVVLLILYGSLYPWHFENRHLLASPPWILLHAWRWPISRFLFRDILTNVVVYMPLGACAFLAFETYSRNLYSRFEATLLLAAGLSSLIEMAQLYVPTRICSMLDVIANVSGAAAGAGVVILMGSAMEPLWRRRLDIVPDRNAVAILLCLSAWSLFPFFPLLSQTVLARKAAYFAEASSFSRVGFASAAMCWFLAGRLIMAAGLAPPSAWLGLLLLVMPAQFFIAWRQPALSDLLGAVTGFAAFAIWGQRGKLHRVVAFSFVALLVIRGVAPFRFQAEQNAVAWIPFAAFLGSDWEIGVLVLLEKLFFYAAAIWALHAAGSRLRNATLIVAATLALIELAQTHLPGRTPDITDPALALLVGAGLRSNRLGLPAIKIDERAL